MRIKRIHIVLWCISVLRFLYPGSAACADIYQCENTFYDSSTLNQEGCKKLSSSSVCGSDGNRYFSPSSNALPTVNEKCSEGRTTPARSPFVTMSKETTLDDFVKAAVEENAPSTGSHTPATARSNRPNTKEFKNSLSKLFEAFECAGEGLDGKTPDKEKCSNFVTPGLTNMRK